MSPTTAPSEGPSNPLDGYSPSTSSPHTSLPKSYDHNYRNTPVWTGQTQEQDTIPLYSTSSAPPSRFESSPGSELSSFTSAAPAPPSAPASASAALPGPRSTPPAFKLESSSTPTPGPNEDTVGPEDPTAVARPKRVRTGCLTCRSRHLKCDEALPVCRNCVRSNRVCERGIRLNFLDAVVKSPPKLAYTAGSSVRDHVPHTSAPSVAGFVDLSRDIAAQYAGGLEKYTHFPLSPNTLVERVAYEDWERRILNINGVKTGRVSGSAVLNRLGRVCKSASPKAAQSSASQPQQDNTRYGTMQRRGSAYVLPSYTSDIRPIPAAPASTASSSYPLPSYPTQSYPQSQLPAQTYPTHSTTYPTYPAHQPNQNYANQSYPNSGYGNHPNYPNYPNHPQQQQLLAPTQVAPYYYRPPQSAPKHSGPHSESSQQAQYAHPSSALSTPGSTPSISSICSTTNTSAGPSPKRGHRTLMGTGTDGSDIGSQHSLSFNTGAGGNGGPAESSAGPAFSIGPGYDHQTRGYSHQNHPNWNVPTTSSSGPTHGSMAGARIHPNQGYPESNPPSRKDDYYLPGPTGQSARLPSLVAPLGGGNYSNTNTNTIPFRNNTYVSYPPIIGSGSTGGYVRSPSPPAISSIRLNGRTSATIATPAAADEIRRRLSFLQHQDRFPSPRRA